MKIEPHFEKKHEQHNTKTTHEANEIETTVTYQHMANIQYKRRGTTH